MTLLEVPGWRPPVPEAATPVQHWRTGSPVRLVIERFAADATDKQYPYQYTVRIINSAGRLIAKYGPGFVARDDKEDGTSEHVLRATLSACREHQGVHRVVVVREPDSKEFEFPVLLQEPLPEPPDA
jgi:hypothetical protein